MGYWQKIKKAQSLIQHHFSKEIILTKKELNRPVIKFVFTNDIIHWNVTTKPHHFHKRGKQKVSKSPMIGVPESDIPHLIKYLIR